MFSQAVWCTFSLKEIAVETFLYQTNISLSKGSTLGLTSTSIKSIWCWLVRRILKNVLGRLFASPTVCGNKISLVMCGQSQVFSLKTFAKEFLIIQFWRLYKPLDWSERELWREFLSSFKNPFPYCLICIFTHVCQHIIS